jgi:hypothetical protein
MVEGRAGTERAHALTDFPSDAYIYVFDLDAYREEVVPAFQQLLREGTTADWVIETCQEDLEMNGLEGTANFPNPPPAPLIDYTRHCTYFDGDFAVTHISHIPAPLHTANWSERACASATCPVRKRCFFHRDHPGGEKKAYQIARLFRMCVSDTCLDQGQFLGNCMDFYGYWELLDKLGVPPESPVRTLLERLGRRGFLFGFQCPHSTDGIHGWLNAEEARQLSDGLFALDLPMYECSFIGMDAFQDYRDIMSKDSVKRNVFGVSYEHPDYSFHELSLSFIRTVCLLAAREGKGVLWGNDIG